MNILLCTDGSRSGLSAVHLGGKIAARMEAQTTLLCVVQSEQRSLERSLQRATETMKRTGADFAAIGRRGQLIDDMLAQLLENEYDLVVFGYYVRSFIEKMIWGSLATRVAHELPLSVLIVRDPWKSIKRILVGVSGGGFTEDCTEWAGQIAAAFDARVTLLHVSQAPPLMYAGLEEVSESLTEFLQADTPAAQALKQAVADLDEMDVRSKVELVRGLPERELLRVMQNEDVDLLIVGSSWAAPPVQRTMLRNIAEKVLLNTRRPVLVVRPSADKEGKNSKSKE